MPDITMSMHQLTNSEFLAAVYRGLCGWVCAFRGNPGSSTDARWHGRPWQQAPESSAVVDAWQDQNAYFSVAEIKEVGGGRARQKEYFGRLLSLVVDDHLEGSLIGTPSWVIETSPNNVQVGVIISLDDPDARNPALVDAVQHEFYERKMLGDNSGNNAVRYVRLPVGTNGKPRESGPFQHRVLHWAPDQVLSLDDACAVFGIDLDEIKARVEARPAGSDVQLFGDVGQAQLMRDAYANVVGNHDYHESLNRIAASMVASGTQPGAVVNQLRGLMEAVPHPRKDTWQERYDDIWRTVDTAVKKFQPQPLAARVEPGEAVDEPLLIRVSDDLDTIEPVNWLINGWVEEDSLSMIYGPSGSGKSFLALDWACCVATGAPWHGKVVKKGPVVIVIGEGKRGIKRRMKAWEKKTGVSLKGAPVFITRCAVKFLDAGAVAELAAAIDAEVAKMDGELPALIMIDTLARNFGDGDENSTEDAGRFIDSMDAIRKAYHAHVATVHHSGLVGGRARGSTAFRAAMDQEFSVMKIPAAKLIRLEAKKMKDDEEPPPMEFRLKKITLAETEVGEVISGAYLELAGSVLDEVIYKAEKPVTLRAVFDLCENDVLPSGRRLESEFGLKYKGAGAQIAKRLLEAGWVAASENSGARLTLSERAQLARSREGGYTMGAAEAGGDEDGEGGDEES